MGKHNRAELPDIRSLDHFWFGPCVKSVCILTIARVSVPIVRNTHGVTQITDTPILHRNADIDYIITMIVNLVPPCAREHHTLHYENKSCLVQCLCLNYCKSIGPSLFLLFALKESLPPRLTHDGSLTCERVARDTLGVRFKNDTTPT